MYLYCFNSIFQTSLFMYITPIQFATPEYDETVQLRDLILRKPLGISFTVEFLSKEYADTHLAAYSDSGLLLGVLLLTKCSEDTVQMRQVAVREDLQKQGIGKALVLFSEDYAKQQQYKKMILHARLVAVPFYKNLAYEVVGEEYMEVGIPHLSMEKIL